jgi:hypothetical protein
MSDQPGPPPPHLPYDELHAAIGDDPGARRELEGLRANLEGPTPDAARVQGHVDALRGVRDVEARIANWWDDPETQRWVMFVTDAGL